MKSLVETLLDAKRASMPNPCRCRAPEPRDGDPEDVFICDSCGKDIPFLDHGVLTAAWEARGWRRETCGQCSGYGVVSHYSAMDFEGAKDCTSCDGIGAIWRSPKGRYALWPGGPFKG